MEYISNLSNGIVQFEDGTGFSSASAPTKYRSIRGEPAGKVVTSAYVGKAFCGNARLAPAVIAPTFGALLGPEATGVKATCAEFCKRARGGNGLSKMG